jgi:hypothetical protein
VPRIIVINLKLIDMSALVRLLEGLNSRLPNSQTRNWKGEFVVREVSERMLVFDIIVSGDIHASTYVRSVFVVLCRVLYGRSAIVLYDFEEIGERGKLILKCKSDLGVEVCLLCQWLVYVLEECFESNYLENRMREYVKVTLEECYGINE